MRFLFIEKSHQFGKEIRLLAVSEEASPTVVNHWIGSDGCVLRELTPEEGEELIGRSDRDFLDACRHLGLEGPDSCWIFVPTRAHRAVEMDCYHSRRGLPNWGWNRSILDAFPEPE